MFPFEFAFLSIYSEHYACWLMMNILTPNTIMISKKEQKLFTLFAA